MSVLSRLLLPVLLLLALPLAAGAEDARAPQWDARVTRGVLDNGLAYYLHDSGKAEDPFNIRLIVHAGSVDEEVPSGLAHMLEHMVFQSTRAHPQTLHRYFDAIGWRTGVQVNAMTRETETQYMIRTRPQDALDLEGAIALAADLAFGAELKAEDWEKERFVILEELRHGEGTAARVNRQKKEVLREGSRYADRPTIGTREGIEAATVEDMRAFHDRFYVASNMSLIISGRIDVAHAEAAIRSSFGQAPVMPRPDRSYTRLPLKTGLSVGLVQDDKGTTSQVTYGFRLAMPVRSAPEAGLAYLQNYFLSRLIRDEVKKLEPHYQGRVESLSFVSQEPTEERLILAFNARIGARTGAHDDALAILLEAVERIRRQGLSGDGFDKLLQKARGINGRNPEAAEARSYAEWEDKITTAVLTGGVLDDPKARSERTAALLDTITLASLNTRLKEMLAAPDQVLFYQAPGGVSVELPEAGSIEAGRDRLAGLKDLPLLPPAAVAAPVEELPAPVWPETAAPDRSGKLVSQVRREAPEILEWTLSNGDRVVWLVRPSADGKVYVSGQSRPGYRNAEYGSLLSQAAFQLWTQSGFNFWSQEEHDRWQKTAGTGWSWSLKDGALDAGVAIEPERLPELIERYAASIRFGTVREDALEALAGLDRGQSGDGAEAESPLTLTLLASASSDQGDDPVSLEGKTTAELETAARALLAEPVTWFAVGPEPGDDIREAFASVMGAVPRSASLTPAPWLQREGWHEAVAAVFDEDRAKVEMRFFEPVEWTPEDAFLMSSLVPLTQQALKNELRQKLGGVYSVQFEMVLEPDTNRAEGTLSFVCDPSRADELTKAALQVLRSMPETVKTADVERIRSDIAFAEQARLQDANTWLRRLALSYLRYGDAGYLTRMERLGDEVTAGALEQAARKVFTLENAAILTSMPKPERQQ